MAYFKKANPLLPVFPPQRKLAGDVGYDLTVVGEHIVPPFGELSISHNICIELPPLVWALVAPRSSSRQKGLLVHLGVIDNGYRGPLLAIVRNFTASEVRVQQGESIAQLLLFPIVSEEFHEIPELSPTERGENGFGSTGR